MSQPRGSAVQYFIYDETTFGVAPGTPSATLLYLTRCGLSASRNLLQDDTGGTGARTRQQPDLGNVDAGGALVGNLAAESIGPILKHAMGGVVTTGAGPYTHTFSLGDLPVGFHLEKDYSAAISGAGRIERFRGCRIGQLQIDLPTEGYATFQADAKGVDATLESTALDATPTDNGHTSFATSAMNGAGSIQEGGSNSGVIKSARIVINNGLDEDGYVLGNGGTRAVLNEGFVSVTGEIVALFDSAALLTKAVNGTASSLKFVLTRGDGLGSAGNESIELFVQDLVYERRSPEVEGPNGVMITLGFQGFGANALTAVVKNAVATI